MAPKKGPTPKKAWVPMARATPVSWSAAQEEHAVFIEQTTGAKIDRPETQEMWKNDLYTVTVRRNDKGVHHLSIRRNDRKPAHDWRHFQQIKNDIAGESIEAIELYPAESRLVDTANQYHLWCLPPGQTFPFGFISGNVSDDTQGFPGAVQRPR
jgi:uncharacterized cupredoxin-like copper-binding protein